MEQAVGPDRQIRDEGRRTFLRRAAVGGAAAGGLWVAPAILTLDAAQACGTSPCTTGTTTFVWTTQYPTQAALGPVDAPTAGHVQALGATAVGGVTVTPTRSDPNSQNNLTGGSWRIRGTAGGACGGSTEQLWHIAPTPNSWLKCRMGGGTVGVDDNRFVDTTLSFSTAVRDLTFSVLDIDNVTSGATYRDRVFITGTPSSGVFSYQVLFQGSGIAVTPALAPGNVGNTSSEWYGAGTAAVSDCSTSSTSPVIDTLGIAGSNGAGNLRICIRVPVTSVTIRHQRGYSNPPPSNSGTALVSGQHIGIGNLTWCTI